MANPASSAVAPFTATLDLNNPQSANATTTVSITSLPSMHHHDHLYHKAASPDHYSGSQASRAGDVDADISSEGDIYGGGSGSGNGEGDESVSPASDHQFKKGSYSDRDCSFSPSRHSPQQSGPVAPSSAICNSNSSLETPLTAHQKSNPLSPVTTTTEGTSKNNSVTSSAVDSSSPNKRFACKVCGKCFTTR
jgi:hypothetical protein